MTHSKSTTGLMREQPVFTSYLVVESTEVQCSVSRCILGTHVSTIEQQVLQVLHVTEATCLHTHTQVSVYSSWIGPASLRTDGGVVLQQQLAAVGGAAHHGRVIQGSQSSAVLVVRRRSEVQQSLRTRSEQDNTQ